MELILYYFIFIFLTFFCYNLFSVNNRNRRRNTVIIPINNFDIEEMHNAVSTYEIVDGEDIICPITQENIPVGQEVQELPCGHKFSKDIFIWIEVKTNVLFVEIILLAIETTKFIFNHFTNIFWFTYILNTCPSTTKTTNSSFTRSQSIYNFSSKRL